MQIQLNTTPLELIDVPLFGQHTHLQYLFKHNPCSIFSFVVLAALVYTGVLVCLCDD